MQIKVVKKIKSWLTFMVVSAVSPLLLAEPSKPLLVLDVQNKSSLPKHYRTTSNPVFNDHSIHLQGLSSLNVMGSGEFSELQLQQVLQHLSTQDVTIVNLRQESQGFLNGDAISWYGPCNAENADKTPKQIEKDEKRRLAQLNQLATVTVYKILAKTPDRGIAETKPIKTHVYQVLSEEELVKKYHLNYARFYIQEFHAPSESEVNRFIQWVKMVPAHQWIYFHCRAGMGRTTTFMAMYDMLRNAKYVTFDDIISRQAAIGGKNLAELPPPKSYKYKWAVERLHFLKKFYAYCRNNHDQFQTPWKE